MSEERVGAEVNMEEYMKVADYTLTTDRTVVKTANFANAAQGCNNAIQLGGKDAVHYAAKDDMTALQNTMNATFGAVNTTLTGLSDGVKEAKDKANNAQTSATQAQTTATEAATAAATADSKATAAQTTANEAATAAAMADSKATAAQTTATEAATAAATADSKATAAQTTATEAATAAQTTANEAMSKKGGTMAGSIAMGGQDISNVRQITVERVDVFGGIYTAQGRIMQNGSGINAAMQNGAFQIVDYAGRNFRPISASNVPASSRRYKEHIVPLSLETAYKILDAVAVEFDWKEDSGYEGGSISFVAEDIAEIDPRYVYKANYVTREAITHIDPDTGEVIEDEPAEYGERVEGLTQNAIIAAQHVVIQHEYKRRIEQEKRIDELTARLEALEAKGQ